MIADRRMAGLQRCRFRGGLVELSIFILKLLVPTLILQSSTPKYFIAIAVSSSDADVQVQVTKVHESDSMYAPIFTQQ